MKKIVRYLALLMITAIILFSGLHSPSTENIVSPFDKNLSSKDFEQGSEKNQQLDDSYDTETLGSKESTEPDPRGTDPDMLPGKTRSTQVGQNPHGGFWKETFNTLNALSTWNNINQIHESLNLVDQEKLLFGDNFTTDLFDSNKWVVEEGQGTVLISSETLIALKQGSTQTAESYLESHRSWPVSRRVEFKWNSIRESGLNGYDHEIDVYRGDNADNRIWITVHGDRRVKFNTGIGGPTIGPPYILEENTWYKFSCKITPYTASLRIMNDRGDILNYQNITHSYTGFGKLRFNIAEKSSLEGEFDLRIDNITLFAGYAPSGEGITKTVALPSEQLWDRLVIDKTEPTAGTEITVDILDASSGEPVEGFSGISSLKFDISGLNSTVYPAVRLRASFKGDVTHTPELRSLALSWMDEKSFSDNFMDTTKLAVMNNVIPDDWTITVDTDVERGYAVSKTLEIPPDHYWGTLLIDKFEPAEDSYIAITILDGSSGKPVLDLVNLFESKIILDYIDPVIHRFLQIRADFYSYSFVEPVLSSWSLNWSLNNRPAVIEFQGPSSVYRGESGIFSVYLSDKEESAENLRLSVFYRVSDSTSSDNIVDWQSVYIESIYFRNGLWNFKFTPAGNAPLGTYSFRAVVSDFFNFTDVYTINNVLQVMKKPLPAPDVILSPDSPLADHDIRCFVDIPKEVEDNDFILVFKWYKNSELQPEIKTDILERRYTSKYDLWRCEVSLFDGYDESKPGYAEVIIGNTPPSAGSGETVLQIKEDSEGEIGFKLDNYFFDADSDILDYTIMPADNLNFYFDMITRNLNIIPEPNWDGSSIVQIYASDDSSDTVKSFRVVVLPENDAPVITSIGNQVLIGKTNPELRFNTVEGEKLRLQVSASDIDGDRLTYTMSRTDSMIDVGNTEISIDKNRGVILFDPGKDFKGSLSLNVSVSDNNGSTVSTNIVISVQARSDSSLAGIFFTSSWIMVIIALIVMCFIYYGVVIARKKVQAYLKRRYRSRLTGEGRYYAYYPLAIATKTELDEGRYPSYSGEFVSFNDPYRAARYNMDQKTPGPITENKENLSEQAENTMVGENHN